MMVLLAARAGPSASVGQAAIKVPDGGLAAGMPVAPLRHRADNADELGAEHGDRT
jgi:hypothetical protein